MTEARVTVAPGAKLSLIHILNTLDSVLERISPRPATDICQQVYHNLLQQEN